jgi:Cu-Zn family superoxide dismutase
MKGLPVAVVVSVSLFLVLGVGVAGELRAEISQATPTGPGDSSGTVIISDGPGGAIVKTALKGLPPGPHGFHIHENGSCQPTTSNGQPAVPAVVSTRSIPASNEGPEEKRDLGGLPMMQVVGVGSATQTLPAPHMKDVAVLRGDAMAPHRERQLPDDPVPAEARGDPRRRLHR